MRTLVPILVLSLGCGLLGETEDTANCGTECGAGDSGSEVATPVDLLLVIDVSGSMKEESSSLALGLDEFVSRLIETRPVTRVAVTTTSADYNASGPTNGVDAGEAGSLTGTPVDLAEPGAAEALRQTLLCDTVYWRDIDLVSDRGYEEGADGSCPLPDGGEIPREYLNCVCGDGDWVTDEGAGNEEGLESAFDALCRASGAVPAACTDEYSPLTEADLGTSANFWREGADAWILLISDEGDGSRRIANTDADPSVYVDLFDETGRDIDFFALIPAYEDSDGSCLDSAQTWGVERYQAAADATGGEWAGLTEIDADCTPNDVAKLATDLLLGG